ncbi:ABC transporter substrate-binding protein [Salidesulfovibrio onnuriiensis]|uniref:ABC transporter substrate-binding protein n=1 Tax=Salidesulfovibrio onnuriiensis TaxID=2583823 RepID=UPI001650A2D4|nr:ABC transporter substrate-binding protein [Salidesulfovibrio onnuriiensis]
MKRVLPFILLLLMVACSDSGPAERDDWLARTYSDIEDAARGTSVRFAMPGSFPYADVWVDNYVIPSMKRQYDISVVRVPMPPGELSRRLIDERNLGREPGSVDLAWIRGEDFKRLRQAGAFFGPIASRLPNFRKYVNRELAAVDFGFANDGYEVPLGKEQFVFVYDSARLEDVPGTFAELREWVRRNPGKFTYPRPPDPVGSAFVRQLFNALGGEGNAFCRGFDREQFLKHSPAVWEYLNDIKPFLWRQGRVYPEGDDLMERLFVGGEVFLNMTSQPLRVRSRVLDGIYPHSVRSFAMRDGSLFSLHFMAVPFNASNKPGALVLANFLMSPAAQYSKFDPDNWGDYPAIDVSRLPESIREKFAAVYLGRSVASPHELAVAAVPEIPAEYGVALDKGWKEHVAP